jgi:hypothetical protein
MLAEVPEQRPTGKREKSALVEYDWLILPEPPYPGYYTIKVKYANIICLPHES